MRSGGGIKVVDVSDPTTANGCRSDEELPTSVCASDLSYIAYGFDKILGHELAGLREDGTAVVVEALYGCTRGDRTVSG